MIHGVSIGTPMHSETEVYAFWLECRSSIHYIVERLHKATGASIWKGFDTESEALAWIEKF
jgi:hypothetical protein